MDVEEETPASAALDMNTDTNPAPQDQAIRDDIQIDTDGQEDAANSSMSSDASDAAKQFRSTEDKGANERIAASYPQSINTIFPRHVAEAMLGVSVAAAAKIYHELSNAAPIKLLVDASAITERIKRLTDQDFWSLVHSWNSKEYAAVVYSEHLRLYYFTQPKEPWHELSQLLSSGWKGEYLGSGHDALFDAVQEIQRDDKMYHDVLPIVQSSGTGKSRVVDYLARSYITFPLCLRQSSPDPSQGYPLADDDPRNYLCDKSAMMDRKRLVLSFMSALFDTASEEEELVDSHNVLQRAENLAHRWHDFFDCDRGNRKQFYKKVVKHAESLCKSAATLDILHVVNALDRLEQKICKHCPSWKKKPWIFWAVDEVHTLANASDSTSNLTSASGIGPKSTLSLLAFILADLKDRQRKTHFFTFFLSTASSLFSLAPPRPWIDSARATSKQKHLPPPFTELTFDPFAEAAPLQEGMDYDFDSITFATLFGRPLFRSIIHHAEDKARAFREVEALAEAKLRGTEEEPTEPAKLSASVIAILGVRLLLEIYPARLSSRQLNEKLIASHLRIAYSVPKHREIIRSGSPSEPLLAHVAATVMNKLVHGQPYIDVWGVLQNFFQDGHGDQGEAGELVGRVLDIRAIDRAILSREETVKPDRLRFLARVPLLDYLKQLLTDEAYEIACTAIADGCEGTLSDVFKDAWMHVSHYVRADSSDVLCVANGWAYYIRGAALQLKHGQYLADAGMFVHLPSQKDKSVNRHTITIVLRQDKASRKNATVPPILASELGIFEGTELKPHISIINCVGAKFADPPPLEVKTRTSSRSKLKDMCFELKLFKHHYRDFEDPHAVTCAESLIDRSAKYLLLDHPWKGQLHTGQVERMKPTFGTAKENIAWFRKAE